MHALIEARRQEIEALCRGLGIRRLDVFGSAVGNSFDVDTSDVDVLVEFDADCPGFDYFATYFTLKEDLEHLLGRPVDVVSVTSIRNPYFRDRVMRTRESLYAATEVPVGCSKRGRTGTTCRGATPWSALWGRSGALADGKLGGGALDVADGFAVEQAQQLGRDQPAVAVQVAPDGGDSR